MFFFFYFLIPLKCIGKEVATKYFPSLRLEIKSLLVAVSKLINWCVGILMSCFCSEFMESKQKKEEERRKISGRYG